MMPKKPIAVYRRGTYETTIMGVDEVAEYCDVHPATVARLLRTGNQTRGGWHFDTPQEYDESVASYMAHVISEPLEAHEYIGKLCWFALYKKQMYSKVHARSLQNAARLLDIRELPKPFEDDRGVRWKYIVVCPDDFVKRWLSAKEKK
jgi:hypothetical protein